MKIYNYDFVTKEYTYTSVADSDPEETKIQGKFVPLLPANATLLKPPAHLDTETVVFNGKKWDIIKKEKENGVE